MSILSFLVNLVSLYLFHGVKEHGHCHKGHKHDHKHKHDHDHIHCTSNHKDLRSHHNHSDKHIEKNEQKVNSHSMSELNNHHKKCCHHDHKHYIISAKPSLISEINNSKKKSTQDIPSSLHKFANISNYKEKIFSQKILNKNETSQKILNGVKSSLDITSKGLLSVLLIGGKILKTSKNILISKKNVNDVLSDFPEEQVDILNDDGIEGIHVSVHNQFEDLKCSGNHNHSDDHGRNGIIACSDSSKKEEDLSSDLDNSSILQDYEDENDCDTGHIGHCHSHDMNFTGMLIHLIGDVISSLCVMVSSVVVVKYDWIYFDSICSVIICLFIILSTVPLNYIIFKKMKKAFSVTKEEEKYISSKINEVYKF